MPPEPGWVVPPFEPVASVDPLEGWEPEFEPVSEPDPELAVVELVDELGPATTFVVVLR